MADNLAHPYNRRRVLTIDVLPDDVLLEIFDSYVFKCQDRDFCQSTEYGIKRKIESWQSLVHVCRRWRSLVLGSPRRLNLQICCHAPRSSAKKTLDVWPETLPLLIFGCPCEQSLDNIIAGLDRISHINFVLCDSSPIEKLWTAMKVPFPELAGLRLYYGLLWHRPVLPDSFLGGSAPRLRFLLLDAIPFPGLPKLLLSATHLVDLYLHNIPHSGYIPPETMATCLSMLTSLETLQLGFQRRQSYPDLKSRRPFLPTRSVLPALKDFWFKGVNEYLEEFVARIDAPQLYRLSTTFFTDIGFEDPELKQFISRAPKLGAYDEARLTFESREAYLGLRQSHPEPSDHGMVEVKILSLEADPQLSSLAQICTLSLRLLLTMENLYIDGDGNSPLVWPIWEVNTKWLDLLLPFTAVKNFYLSDVFLPYIVRALHTGGRTTEVLPALQNVLLERYQLSEPVQKDIAQFISARQLTNHPVVISVWDRDVADIWYRWQDS